MLEIALRWRNRNWQVFCLFLELSPCAALVNVSSAVLSVLRYTQVYFLVSLLSSLDIVCTYVRVLCISVWRKDSQMVYI